MNDSMRSLFLHLLAGASLVVLAGCGRSPAAEEGAETPAAPALAMAPAPVAGAGVEAVVRPLEVALTEGAVWRLPTSTPGGAASHAATRWRAELPLAAGEILELMLVQSGIDAALELRRGADDVVLAHADSPTGGRGVERLRYLAPWADRYVLDVVAEPGPASAGLELRVLARHAASPREVRLGALAEELGRAERLRRERTPESERAAAEVYGRLALEWERLGERAWEALARGRRALLLERQTDRETERAWLERSLPVWTEVGDLESAARAHSRLFTLAARRAESAAQMHHLRAAAELWKRLRDGEQLAYLLSGAARFWQEQGSLARAEAALDGAAELYAREEKGAEQASVLASLASLYLEAGHLELARSALEQASAALPADAALGARAYVDQIRGRLARGERRYPEARSHFERALEGYRRAGEPLGEVRVLQGLAFVAFLEGDDAAAVRLSEEALERAPSSAGVALRLTLEQNLGQVAVRAGDIGRARGLLERALEEARRHGLRALESAVRLGLARAYRAEGRLDEALAACEGALAIVEELRRDAVRRDVQLSLLADTQDFFDLAVEVLVALERARPNQGYAARALLVSEASRARRLLDEVEASRRLGSGGATRLGDRAHAKQRLRDAEMRLLALVAEGASPAELARVEGELVVAQEVFRELGTSLFDEVLATAPGAEPVPAALPAGAALLPEATALAAQDLAELRASHLDRGAVLLEYDLGAEASFLFAVTAEDIRIVDLPAAAVVEALAEEAHRVLARSDQLQAGRRPGEVIRRVGAKLLEKVSDLLPGRELVVVPDGALHLLPFGALAVPGIGGGEEPLLLRHDVRSVPSAAAWLALERRERARPRRPARLAVFSDPVFSSRDERLEDVVLELHAPSPRVEGAGGARALERGLRAAASELDRLPHTASEADAILRWSPPGAVLDLRAFAATKASLGALPARSLSILHFATHGMVNTRDPALSGLALSLLDEEGRPIDGALRAGEIERLDLPADLVVLAACRTAAGKIVPGEGVLSLAPPFFRAGASRVVVSAWPVDDEATAVLMDRFYEGLLRKRLPPVTALREAQIAVRSDPRWRAPRYWAGFVLQGAGEWRTSF